MAFAIYNSVAFSTASGLAVAAGSTVEVRRELDNGLATIYEDRAGATPISQPGFVADSEGYFEFYAEGIAQGYKITVTYGAESQTLRNQAVGTAAELDAGTVGAAVLAADTNQEAREAAGLNGTSEKGRVFLGDDTDFRSVQIANGFALIGGFLEWSVSGSALTIAIKTEPGSPTEDPSTTNPVYVLFRDPTAGVDGLQVVKITSATSLVVSSGSTLGTVASQAFRLWVVGFIDGSTFRLGVIQCVAGTGLDLGIYPLAGWGIASSTAEGGAGAADSAQVFYTGTAVSSVPYTVLGYATWESGLGTPGTWSANPSRAQHFGPGVPLPGQTIQTQIDQEGGVTTFTTTYVIDDSIPQNTEGTEIVDVAITPRSAANLLEIESRLYSGHSVAAWLSTFIAQDGVSNSLAASMSYLTTATGATEANCYARKIAGSTSALAFNLRAGYHSAGTTTINGSVGSRYHAGVADTHILAREIMT